MRVSIPSCVFLCSTLCFLSLVKHLWLKLGLLSSTKLIYNCIIMPNPPSKFQRVFHLLPAFLNHVFYMLTSICKKKLDEFVFEWTVWETNGLSFSPRRIKKYDYHCWRQYPSLLQHLPNLLHMGFFIWYFWKKKKKKISAQTVGIKHEIKSLNNSVKRGRDNNFFFWWRRVENFHLVPFMRKERKFQV